MSTPVPPRAPLHPPEEFPEDTCCNSWISTCACPGVLSYCACNTLCHIPRKLVSNHKKRYEQEGFNLDLVYLTSDKRIIVHGFPATGIEHFYRNPRYELRRFLEEKHSKHYKIFNMCSEPGRGYDHSIFDNRVERYPFRDHGVPMINSMLYCMESAKEWLDADPKNVVCFHCKAGKGRAGTMSTCFLLRAGYYDTADECLAHYNRERVKNNKGLTVASQIKYVHLYEQLLRKHLGFNGNLRGTTSLLQSTSTANAVENENIVERNPKLNVERPTYSIVKVEILDFESHNECLKLPENVGEAGNFLTPINHVVMTVAQGTNFEPIIRQKVDVDPRGVNPYTFNCKQGENLSAVEGNFRLSFYHETKKLWHRKSSKKLLFEFWDNTLYLSEIHKSGYIDVDFFKDCDVKKKVAKKIKQNIEANDVKVDGDEDIEMEDKTKKGERSKEKKVKVPTIRIHLVEGAVQVSHDTTLATITNDEAVL